MLRTSSSTASTEGRPPELGAGVAQSREPFFTHRARDDDAVERPLGHRLHGLLRVAHDREQHAFTAEQLGERNAARVVGLEQQHRLVARAHVLRDGAAQRRARDRRSGHREV
jgi:hypothetical protein